MLELVPITLKEANAFVERYHRHHKPVVALVGRVTLCRRRAKAQPDKRG